ncbi:hypothetical protein [Streptomyces sp. NPDC051567]|uniref:hypothetical protein n=1 Tax=Streptomyces sp. NPDC051567 TaxID=3365660 RepID=UPI003797D11D
MTHNPAQYARVAADSLARLVQDVRTGRAEWAPHTVRPAAADLLRTAEAMAAALQQMTTVLDPRAPQTRQHAAALHLAGQAAATCAAQLRTALRTLH